MAGNRSMGVMRVVVLDGLEPRFAECAPASDALIHLHHGLGELDKQRWQ